MRIVLTVLASLFGLLLFAAVGLMIAAIAIPNFHNARSLVYGATDFPMPLVFLPPTIFAIVFFLVLLFVGLAVLKSMGGRRKTEKKGLDVEETQIVQEVYRGLFEMEKRVEALETILLDKAGIHRSGRSVHHD